MIIPALDLINGNVVRLYQGNYKQQINYGIDSLSCLKNYLLQGANVLHLVDLTGARDPTTCQLPLLTHLLSQLAEAKVQIGGGIRSHTDIEALLSAGATRVVIGSSAIKQPEETQRWFKSFGPDAIALALDVRIDINGKNQVVINGWQEDSGVTLEEVINQYCPLGLKHVLCTDVCRDGTLTGSNIDLYQSLCSAWPEIIFQASGGIGSLEDIALLRHSGVQSVIIGKAFLEKKFTVAEAIECWQNG